MANDKTEYYSLDSIKKYTDCRYKILFGMRSNGKSYAVKSDAIAEAWKSKKCTFGLIRRMDADTKTELIESYFSDMWDYVKKLTKGEYNAITIYRRRIYLANIDDDQKITRGLNIGCVFALALDERYKSTAYPDMQTIIFEEFITERLYLKNETQRLQNLISTIFRRRVGTVYLIGNTVSRQSPYFFEWGLKGIPKQQINTIDVYTLKGLDDSEVKIAVEYCGKAGEKKSGMFFGQSAKMIDGAEWQTDEYPHLPKDFKEYDLLYRISLRYKDYAFNLCLLNDDDVILLYIYPATNYMEQRILQEDFSADSMISPTLKLRNRAEIMIHDLYYDNKVVYANNLCGQDFNNCIKMMTKNPLTLV